MVKTSLMASKNKTTKSGSPSKKTSEEGGASTSESNDQLYEVEKVNDVRFIDGVIYFNTVWAVDHSGSTNEPLESFKMGLKNKCIRQFIMENPDKWTAVLERENEYLNRQEEIESETEDPDWKSNGRRRRQKQNRKSSSTPSKNRRKMVANCDGDGDVTSSDERPQCKRTEFEDPERKKARLARKKSRKSEETGGRSLRDRFGKTRFRMRRYEKEDDDDEEEEEEEEDDLKISENPRKIVKKWQNNPKISDVLLPDIEMTGNLTENREKSTEIPQILRKPSENRRDSVEIRDFSPEIDEFSGRIFEMMGMSNFFAENDTFSSGIASEIHRKPRFPAENQNRIGSAHNEAENDQMRREEFEVKLSEKSENFAENLEISHQKWEQRPPQNSVRNLRISVTNPVQLGANSGSIGCCSPSPASSVGVTVCFEDDEFRATMGELKELEEPPVAQQRHGAEPMEKPIYHQS